MKCEATYIGTLTWTDHDGEPVDAEALEALLDAMLDTTMDLLLDLDGIEDPLMSGSLTKGTIEVTFQVVGATTTDAIVRADTALRSALHGAGFGTPDWKDALKAHRALVDWERTLIDWRKDEQVLARIVLLVGA